MKRRCCVCGRFKRAKDLLPWPGGSEVGSKEICTKCARKAPPRNWR